MPMKVASSVGWAKSEDIVKGQWFIGNEDHGRVLCLRGHHDKYGLFNVVVGPCRAPDWIRSYVESAEKFEGLRMVTLGTVLLDFPHAPDNFAYTPEAGQAGDLVVKDGRYLLIANRPDRGTCMVDLVSGDILDGLRTYAVLNDWRLLNRPAHEGGTTIIEAGYLRAPE